MYLKNNQFHYSPSDLITFLESPFASSLDHQKLLDPELIDLMDPDDDLMSSLQSKGFDHEDQYSELLKAQGSEVYEVKKASNQVAALETIKAMQAGKEVILQGYLELKPFAGFSDFLVKVEGHSNLGDFHYEAKDTKLAKKLKPYFIIQLCCYSEMLEQIQGVRPQYCHVVLGNNEEISLKVDKYYAYYQAIKRAFLDYHQKQHQEIPDAALSKSHGRWSTLAVQQLVDRDHLSIVANLTSVQIKKLEKAGIDSVQKLADSELKYVKGMADETFARAKHQARLQILSRDQDIPVYEVLPHEEDVKRGLATLPPHSDFDVFFDIEGYPHMEGGLEYLWGNSYFDENGVRQFKDFWAHNHIEEKQAFIEFIDWIYDRWLKDPKMHVYHYANYEIAAIKKLMGRYGVCEDKVDNLLRNHVFIDLYNVVRQGMMIGEPRYSIKNVEHIYRGRRDTDVQGGGESILVYEKWLDHPDGETWEQSEALKALRDYNIDDCDSTQELTEWLREEQKKHDIEFLEEEFQGELELKEEVTALTRFRDELLAKADQSKSDAEKDLWEMLGWSLEFHRRELKPVWWKFFERMNWSELELYDDLECLAGLKRTEAQSYAKSARSKKLVYQYQIDLEQPYKGSAKKFYIIGEDEKRVAVHNYEADQGLIELVSGEPLDKSLSLVPDDYVCPKKKQLALQSVAEAIWEDGVGQSAITDFLMRKNPNIKGHDGGIIVKNDQEVLPQIIEAVVNLDQSYLCIQGPPGAGKTYTAKHIIAELIKDGKKVGISSNSHKAIINLMAGTADHLKENQIDCELIKAGGDKKDPFFDKENVTYISSVKGLKLDQTQCFGGTAWAFCNEMVEDFFDYLFIDEAGQLSVADLIGMSRSCNNIVLMGDQMQLGQPLQGSHPAKSGSSILEYLLEDDATIKPELGVFLPKTYRMHPDICKVISNQVYDDRLQSDESAHLYEVDCKDPTISQKSGIIYCPVEHEGNLQASDEEVAEIKSLCKRLIGSPFWKTKKDGNRLIEQKDILVVAPYNFQVNKLKAALGEDTKVGTVDKFQGQEAPIVILSMCTSNASESPRGLDFLFSKNRLNVAISRAQALAFIVGNPNLTSTTTNNIEQMELVNFYCALTEGSEIANA